MNYKVLYRKYRPDTFENVVGQEYIIKTLKNSVMAENISHAYIFSGPRGTGKTSTAKIFAKAINCLNPVNGSPCNECINCKNFKDNPDIIEIDAASNNGVDQIRELIDNVKLTPTSNKYKVYIIDEVHMLTISAFNALLLTLEEPPSHVVFILATTNIESVPITILSRCQRYDFSKISDNDILKRLKEISELENINIEEEALKEIALIAEGGMRDALSILDQLSKSGELITLDIVEKQMRTISNNSLEQLLEYIENENVEKIIEYLNVLREKSIDYKMFVKKMIAICSYRAKQIKSTNSIKKLSYSEYQELIIELIDSLNKININIDPYVFVELILLKYIKTPEISDKKETKQIKETIEINKNEQQNADLNNENKPMDGYDDIIRVRINNCFVAASKDELNKFKSYYIEYIDSSEYKNILLDTNVMAASHECVIISAESDHTAFNLNEMLEDIESSINKFINADYRIIFISNEQWNKEKSKYIKNIKNGYKYELIKENPIKKESNTSINEVFDINKVEII